MDESSVAAGLLLLLAAATVALLAAFLVLLARYVRLRLRFSEELDARLDAFAEAADEQRDDAVKRSRAVSLGKAVEHLVPFMPDFPHDPGDARFLGAPIDFVVFAGLRQRDRVDEIVFVEVKSGRGRLSARERSVRDAVLDGRVVWREVRVP